MATLAEWRNVLHATVHTLLLLNSQSSPNSQSSRTCAAWGVFAASAISEGDVLCTIPKGSILSIRTSAAVEMLMAEHLGGGLGLIVAVMYERALGEGSEW